MREAIASILLALGGVAEIGLARDQAPPPPPETRDAPAARDAAPKPSLADADDVRKEKEGVLRRRFIPEPIPSDELDRLPDALAIPAESRADYAEARQAYVDAWQAIRGDDSRDLRVLLPAAFQYDHVDQDFRAVHTPELLSLLRMRDKLAERAQAVDDNFALAVTNLASPERRAERLRWKRERAQVAYGQPVRLPAAGVELVELLSKAGLTDAELEACEGPLLQYTERLTAALRERFNRLRDLEREEAEMLVTLGPQWRAGRTAAEALEVERDLARVAIAETLTELPLRDLNQATIANLRHNLPPPLARKALEAYQRVVHPGLFEDERALRQVVEEMLALPGLGDDEVAAIVATLSVTEDRLRSGGTQAVELADGMIAAANLPPEDAVSARLLLERKLHSVQAARRNTIRESAKRLVPMLGSSNMEFLPRLTDYLATLDAQDRAASYLAQSLESRAAELDILRAMGLDTAASHDPSTGLAGGAEPPVAMPAGPTNGVQAPNSADGGNGDGTGAGAGAGIGSPSNSGRGSRGRGSR